MWSLKGIEIKNLYKVKHFVEKTSYCELYSGIDLSTSKMVNLSIYKNSEIASDDLDENGNLKEIQFLELGFEVFPKLLTFGEFSHNSEEYRYIATEFIIGENVKERIDRNGPFNEFDAIKIIVELCKIGEKLHSMAPAILINGLNLQNIIIDTSEDKEKIKFRNLINMRFLDDAFKCVYLDGLNVNHIAPEILDDDFSKKSDQYNIGTLAYQMLTGQLPYYNDDTLDIKDPNSIIKLKKYRNDSFEFSNLINEDIKNVLSKVFSKDKNDRYSSLTELSRSINKEKAVYGPGKDGPVIINEQIVKKGNGFMDVAGMEDLKKTLQSKVIDVLKRPEHYKKYNVKIPNGMLLYGPPGCGKSFIAEKFGEEAGFNFKLIDSGEVSSSYVRGGVLKIEKLFNEAQKNAPSILCFDEADAIMRKRTGSENNQHTESEVNEYLKQINNCSDRGIFVIAMTNFPDIIDRALIRSGRLEHHIYVPEPDFEAREKLFQKFMSNRFADSEINFSKLSELTKNYSSSDIGFIVNDAAHKAAIKEVPISTEILIESTRSKKSSLNEDDLKKYRRQKEKFEGENEEGPGTGPIISQGPIGFKK